jgi:hypothetical protein
MRGTVIPEFFLYVRENIRDPVMIKIKHGPRISADALSGVTGVVTLYFAFMQQSYPR